MSDSMPQYPAPEVKGGIVPYLQVDGVFKAVDFYTKAFGAETAFAFPPDEKGRTMHAHIYINGSSVMLSDAYPEHGHVLEKPGAFTMQLILTDDNVEEWWKRAADAGCEIIQPLDLMFWGDRWGLMKDPFGVSWGFNAPVNK